MKATYLLSITLCLSLSTIQGMRKINIKSPMERMPKVPLLNSVLPKAPHNTILNKQPFLESYQRYNILTQRAAQAEKPLWANKFTNFPKLNSKKIATVKAQPYTTFAWTRINTEQEAHTNRSTFSLWGWLKGLVGAALAGGVVASMSEDEHKEDILSRAEFEDLRKFIELVQDPELEQRWNMCKQNPECNKIICNANLITIINSHPYIVLKDHQFDRVINAKLAEQVIEDNNLTWIGIPKKTILFDGTSWKVVTEKIEGSHPTALSLEKVQQLVTFILDTEFRDIQSQNIIFNEKSKKLFIIDTENRSYKRPGPKYKVSALAKGILLNQLAQKLRDLYQLDPLAQEWLASQKIEDGIEDSSSSRSIDELFIPVTDYTFKGLDLEKIRTQANNYAKIVSASYAEDKSYSIGGFRKHEIIELKD